MKIVWAKDGRVEETRKLTDEELALHQIKKLRKLRDDYFDEIPAEIIHSPSPDNNYKCRTSWFGMLFLRLGKLEMRGLLPYELIEEYHRFMEGYRTHLKQNRGLTTAENIRDANSLINTVIDSLEARL